MFDIAFSELMIIGVVALVVIGPERLPRVARTIGALLGRAQRYVSDVKADINREIHLDELKKMQAQMSDSFRSVEDSVRQEVDTARATVETPMKEAAAQVEAAPTAAEEAPLPAPVATYGLAEQIALAEAETPAPATAAAPDTPPAKTPA